MNAIAPFHGMGVERDLITLRRVASGHVLFGQDDKALRVLQLALWLQPDDAETLKLTALVAFNLGQLDDVVTICDELTMRGIHMGVDLTRASRIARLRLRAGP